MLTEYIGAYTAPAHSCKWGYILPLSFPAFVPADEQAFRNKYRNFAPLLDRGDLQLWKELNNEAAFSLMRAVTFSLELPAVSGIARLVSPILSKVEETERDYIKKGVGAIVCSIMETNGFRKTGTKKAVPPVPQRVFNRAAVYQAIKRE